MRALLTEKWPRLLLTLLLAAGLLLPLLGMLGAAVPVLPCLLLLLAEALALEAVGLTRRTALWGSLALALTLLVWAFSAPGSALLSDLLRAFTLQVTGVPGALPLVAREASLVLTTLITLLSFLCCRKSAGGLGAVLAVIASLLLLWLGDRPDLLPRLLPAGLAALLLLLMERHEELSLPRILPWAAAGLLLAFALTPPSGLVLPALKERTDALRQNVLDRLFFTEPRDVFSLSSEGYYPQGLSQLGGPVTPSDRPVLQVSAPRAAYLRGAILNAYDGRCWRNTLGGRRYLWDARGQTERRADLFDQQLPSGSLASALTAESTLSVRMLGSGTSTLFVPQRVRELRAGGELVPYFTDSSELFVTRNLEEGDTWSVSAPLMTGGDAGLGTVVDAAAREEDDRYDALREIYTALPPHLEEPVWQLAADLTEGLSSPYEKALALQNHLSRNYRYRLDVPVQPGNVDFVTNFLFNTREGYCTYFASALTVLCRMAGLPARYVEGYLAEPGRTGEALVTGLNAHAWTEVYFRGFGWLTFDATPHRTGNSETDSDPAQPSVPPVQPETPTPSPAAESEESETPSPAVSPDPEDRPPEGAESSAGFPWIPAVLLLVLLLLLLLLLRWRLTDPAFREKRLPEEGGRFEVWLEDALSRLSAAGFVRASGETLMSFTRRLDAESGPGVPLSELGECASLLRYGRVQALPEDTRLARETAGSLRRALPRRARLIYAWRRLLGRGRAF